MYKLHVLDLFINKGYIEKLEHYYYSNKIFLPSPSFSPRETLLLKRNWTKSVNPYSDANSNAVLP